MERVTLSQLAARIRSADDLVLLVGAGISMLPPTGLPSGPALRDMAIAGICAPAGLKRWQRRLHRLPRYQKIVPEVLFQALYECIGDKLHPFFDVLRGARPNAIHELVAEFCAAGGVPLTTTNFDLLVEECAEPSVSVLHLHGDLSDPAQMVVRIHQVGRGLSPGVERELRRMAAGCAVCVLGYSGNDTDVFLALRAARPRTLFWLTRSEDDWAWTNIPRFDRGVAPVVAASGDLLDLVQRIAGRRADGAAPAPAPARDTHRERTVRQWSRGLSLPDRIACLSAVFSTLTEYGVAAELAEQGMTLTREPGQATWFRVEAANALRIVGDFERAERWGEQAITLAENDPYRAAKAANALGLVMLEKTEPEPLRAIEWFERGLALLGSPGERKGRREEDDGKLALRGRLHNNLGLACTFADDLERGIRAFRESLKIKAATGDLIGLSQTYVNGSLAYYRTGRFRNAYRWRRHALALIEKYDLVYQRAYLYRRLGIIAANQGRPKQGLRHLERAREIYEEIEAPFDAELTRTAIGQVEAMIAGG